jgi:hypothetical protein
VGTGTLARPCRAKLGFFFSPNKNGASPFGRAPLVFCLYIQNIKSKGVNWTFPEQYIRHAISDLSENHPVSPLDRIFRLP